MRVALLLLPLSVLTAWADSIPKPEVAAKRVLRLEPSPGNPRNSEGDFIQLKDGRLLFIYTHFTGGEGDDARAHLASRESRDGGLTWSTNDTVVVANEGGRNVMSVSLVRLRSGPIALFYLRKNSKSDCRPILRISSDEAKSWSAPIEVITNEVGYYVLNNDRVVQLASRRLVVPVAQHAGSDGKWRAGQVLCFLSDDEGRSWRPSKTRLIASEQEQPVDLMEPGVVETGPNEIFMLLRTRLGCQYESRSSDKGETWTMATPSLLRSPESPATLVRVPGTNSLLVIWNDHHDKPLSYSTSRPPTRTPLSAALSRDVGRSWSKAKTIETDPESGFCYTAAEWVGERLLLVYCAHRSRWGLQTTQIISIPASELRFE